MSTPYASQGGSPSDSTNRQLMTSGASGTAPFATAWQKFVQCDICAQISGDADAVVAVVERSDVNPDQVGAEAQIAPADADGFSGDPAALPPNIYTEPGVGWWRINVGTVTSGTVNASLSGVG